MNPADGGGAAGQHAPAQVTLIVDGANVMGSRADGWWRDRAGAMARLHDELVALADRGITVPPPGGDQPADAQPAETRPAETRPAETQAAAVRWFPQILLVVEGKSRAVIGMVTPDSRVQLVAAPGEGDDEIARLAGSVAGRRIVITADQALRDRAQRAGAQVAGPRWLTSLLT
jgi:hypothetical protein